jgi:hypothetical protein
MTHRFRNIGALLGAVILAVSLALTLGMKPAHAAPLRFAARAVTTQFLEMYVVNQPNWCITALNDQQAGSELVLGRCAGAQSQLFRAQSTTGSNVEIQNEWGIANNGLILCITFDMPQGGADGYDALLGQCAATQNQAFIKETGYGGGVAWYMPDRTDDNGDHVAIDNEGGNLVVNNHIDESHYSATISSESWQGLAY